MIIGARTEEQLTDNLASAELDAHRRGDGPRLDAVSAEPLRYPYWHQAGNIAIGSARPISACSALTSPDAFPRAVRDAVDAARGPD